jgi:hypothetical protein
MVTDKQIEELFIKHQASTKGKWEVVCNGHDQKTNQSVYYISAQGSGCCDAVNYMASIGCGFGGAMDKPDAEFCAAAHEQIPELIKQIRDLKELILSLCAGLTEGVDQEEAITDIEMVFERLGIEYKCEYDDPIVRLHSMQDKLASLGAKTLYNTSIVPVHKPLLLKRG